MNRVAILAGNSVQRMAGMIELRLPITGRMASQAKFGVRLRIAFEGEDQLAGGGGFRIVAVGRAFGVRVSLARAVAHLAPDHGILMLRQGRMGGFGEFEDFGLMARSALIVANILRCRLQDGDRFRCHRYRRIGRWPRLSENCATEGQCHRQME